VFSELVIAVEGGERGVLRDCGRVDEEVLLQGAHGTAQRGGHHTPADA
jgi:hypothetical protein